MGWPPKVLRLFLLGAVVCAEPNGALGESLPARTTEAAAACHRGPCEACKTYEPYQRPGSYDSFSLVQTHSLSPVVHEQRRPANALSLGRQADHFQQRVNDTTRRVDEQRSPAAAPLDPGDFHRRLLNGTIQAVSGPRLPLAVAYFVVVCLVLVLACFGGVRKVCNASSGVGAICTVAGTAFSVLFLGFLAAGFFSLWYLSGAVIKEAIEHFDMSFLGVEIEMDSLDINIFNGQVEVQNIELQNPSGYAIKTLLKVSRLHIDLAVSSLICSFGKHVLAQRILLDDVKVIYERSWTSSNVADVLRFLGSDQNMGDFKVTIQEVNVTNIDGQASSSLFTGVNYNLKVPDIYYEDFTSQMGHMGITGVVKTLLSQILHNIIEATTAVPGLVRKRN